MSVPGGWLSPSISTFAVKAGNEQHPNDTPESDDIFDTAITNGYHHAALIAYCWCLSHGTPYTHALAILLGKLERNVLKFSVGGGRLGRVI